MGDVGAAGPLPDPPEPDRGRPEPHRDRPVEVLVLAAPGTDVRDVLARMPHEVDVVHLLPPRAAIVRAPTGRVPEVTGARCHRPPLPEEERAGLTAAERVFVAAWELRSSGLHPGPRVGEGLPWDAPGFEPPDR